MSDKIEFAEKQFDDVSDFGDNGDRVAHTKLSPTLGETKIVRLSPASGYRQKINLIVLNADLGTQVLTGAYALAQAGTRLQIRFDTVVKFEHRMNWVGLSGYVGGADDYQSEIETVISLYSQEVGPNVVIDLYVAGDSIILRMYYISLQGVLDDGTKVKVAVKQGAEGVATIPIYTVPSGRILYADCIIVSVRNIDLYFGKAYLVVAGINVMAIDVCQTEVGGVYGIVLPFWELPLPEEVSLGIRMDSFCCGNEIVNASIYYKEEQVGGGGGLAAPVIDGAHVIG